MERKDKPGPANVNVVHAKPFAQMTAFEKIKHIGKVIAFVATFGFAFPNVFSE